MIHLMAIVLGILVLVALIGFFYVIHSVLKHFGLDTEDVVIGVMACLIAVALSWLFGTIALELLGMI